ncbi:MAG: DsbA family protein [Pseudomonadota bacterium]
MTDAETPRVYHAFRSPYSRLGLHVVKRAGLNPQVIPFTGPPDGAPFSDPMENKPKRRYYTQDAPRMTLRMGLPIAPPRPFDVDFDPANRALAAANADGRGLDFAIAVSDARWGRGENVSDLQVLQKAAEEIEWSTDAVDSAQDSADVAALLAEQRDLIKADGVFGVPFAVSGENKYWGHDRFDLFVEELTG